MNERPDSDMQVFGVAKAYPYGNEKIDRVGGQAIETRAEIW